MSDARETANCIIAVIGITYISEKIELQFHRHHSYFRKDFQMLLAIKEGIIYPPHHTLGQIKQQQNKNLSLISKIRKNWPLNPSYVVPLDNGVNSADPDQTSRQAV